MNKKFVVIGSSAAGMGAVATLRQLDAHAEIICISDEMQMPYNKCLLPDYVAGDKQLADIFTRPQEFFDQQKINLLLGKKVEKISPVARKIILVDGDEISYDKLLIATGAHARKINLEKMCAGIFYFYSLHDILRLKEYCASHAVSSVLVVGSGLTGMECADALEQNGISVSVLESNSRVINSLLDQQGAAVVRLNAEKIGVRFFLDEELKEIVQDDGRIAAVKTKSGRVIGAQMIVFAIGSVQNIKLAHDAAIDTSKNGILVNECMQTSSPDVYAAGDCVETFDRITNNRLASFKWSDAVSQGVCAAHAMVGQSKPYAGIFQFYSSYFFQNKFFVAGSQQLAFDQEFNKVTNSSYVSCKMREGKLCSVIIIGYEKIVPIIRAHYARQDFITESMLEEIFNS
ncbi:NAD(P)/FAD-dependent oxidoreductase [Candidatus Dependentiae bacterium]|nr:NAD(P)/FAD-dependent oxidoreductase [Candidatus Dependentiae bacterium]